MSRQDLSSDDGDELPFAREKRKPRHDRSVSVRFADSAPEPASREPMRDISPAMRPRPPFDPARPREFFPATCSACGVETTVPFRPSQGRPVHCRACFQRPA